MRTPKLALLLCLLASCTARPAAADWFFVPFSGATFGSETNYVDLDSAAGRTNVVFGVSAGVIGRGFLGLELDSGIAPGFFEREGSDLVTSSRVTTVMGNVIVTTPLSFSGEGLRPYVVGGLGLLHAASDDFSDVFTFRRDLLGMTVGGGATGYFTGSRRASGSTCGTCGTCRSPTPAASDSGRRGCACGAPRSACRSGTEGAVSELAVRACSAGASAA